MSDKREKVILIRVTQSEHDQLMNLKDRSRLAEWMREHCLATEAPQKKVSSVVERVIPKEVALEFSKIGSNINQIGRAMNIAVRNANDMEMKDIAMRACFLLEEMEEHMSDIRNYLLTK